MKGTQSHIAWEMNLPVWDCQVRFEVPGLCSFLLVCALEHLQMELSLPSWHRVSSAQAGCFLLEMMSISVRMSRERSRGRKKLYLYYFTDVHDQLSSGAVWLEGPWWICLAGREALLSQRDVFTFISRKVCSAGGSHHPTEGHCSLPSSGVT